MAQFVFGLLAGIIVGLVMEWVIDWSGLFPKKATARRTPPHAAQNYNAPVINRVAETAAPVEQESIENTEADED